MRHLSIAYKKSIIHAFIFGAGKKLLICFHGYGENGNSFEPLEKKLGNEYTLVAIDFPFHGGTKWNGGLLMTPDDLLNILNSMLEQIKIAKDKSSKFSVIAFSLGGRVALHLLQSVPVQIERMVLLAPDGLHQNFWYWFATQTSIGHKLFAYTVKKPSWFFVLTSFGKLRSLNKSIVRIIHYYLDDEEGRSLPYRRWTTMRKFTPEKRATANAINNYQIPVRFLFGNYDSVILSRLSKFFKRNQYVKVTVINAGHQLLKEKFTEDIALLFSQ